MQKNQFFLFALASSVLLVGAGCDIAGYQQAKIDGQQPEISVDSAVNSMIQTGADEQQYQAQVRTDAQLYGSEEADVNAFVNSSYEPQ